MLLLQDVSIQLQVIPPLFFEFSSLNLVLIVAHYHYRYHTLIKIGFTHSFTVAEFINSILPLLGTLPNQSLVSNTVFLFSEYLP